MFVMRPMSAVSTRDTTDAASPRATASALRTTTRLSTLARSAGTRTVSSAGPIDGATGSRPTLRSLARASSSSRGGLLSRAVTTHRPLWAGGARGRLLVEEHLGGRVLHAHLPHQRRQARGQRGQLGRGEAPQRDDEARLRGLGAARQELAAGGREAQLDAARVGRRG